MAQPTADARRKAPRSIDLSGIDTSSADAQNPLELIGAAAAETAVGVTGVHHLGGTAARGLDRASRAVLGRSTSPGVTVSQIDGVTTIDIDLVADYPTTVTEVAARVQDQVSHAAKLLTDESVVVNVTVTDVFGPYDRDVVAETDAAISGAVEKTKSTAAEVTRRTKEAASVAAERTKEAAAVASERTKDAAAQVREKTADAADEIREGAERAVEAAREGAARASDSTREGAARAADAIDDGVAKARNAAADAADRLDAELDKRGAEKSAAAPSDAPEVTVIVGDSATVTVDADSDVTVRVDSDDDVTVSDGTTAPGRAQGVEDK